MKEEEGRYYAHERRLISYLTAMAPLEGGPPNTVGVTNLIVFIDMATLGGCPADPVGATSLLVSIRITAPGGSSADSVRMTN